MFNSDLIQIFPILFLVITGILLMLLDAFKVRSILPIISAIGFGGAIILSIPMNENQEVMQVAFRYMGIMDHSLLGLGGMIATDGLASIVTIFLCASGLFTLFFLGEFMKRQEKPIHDVYALLVFCVVGMVLLANARDLIITFIGLETMSICLYIMAALFKKDLKSNEAGLKYFLLGAFSTGFFLYGIALLYGGAGSTNYAMMDISNLQDSGLMYPGLALILVGFLFKVSAFPFHAWTPDVYSGTPTPLAGFMATGSKAAAFVAFGILLNEVLDNVAGAEKVYSAVAVLAILTMIYGNIVAVQQKNLKRLLAYSSIAHSGYVLLALSAGDAGLVAAIYYMFIYTLMNIGAFGLVGMSELRHEDVNIDSWKGMGMKNPWYGAALAIFLFSLAGIPPLAGFMAKYILFVTIIKSGLVLFAIVGIMTSVIGAYYYIRIIVTMFFGKSDDAPATVPTNHWAPVAGVAVLAVLVLLFGVYPSIVTDQLDSLYSAAINADFFSQSAP